MARLFNYETNRNNMGRSIIDRVAEGLGYVRETRGMVPVSSVAEYDIPAYLHWKTSDYYAAYAGWVFACAKARAEDTADIELDLHRRVGYGESELVTEHEALALLRSVNPWQTFRQLTKSTQTYLDLTGEAVWYLNRAAGTPQKAAGKVTAIWALRPDYVNVIASRESYVEKYEYRVPGCEKIDIDPDNIVHFRTVNPTDPYRGMSIIRAAALTIDHDEYAEKYNRKFFKNSAIPAVVLETDQRLTDQVVQRVKDQWREKYGGIANSHQTAILESGLKAHPFQIPQKDMEFLAGQGFTRDKIMAMFNVPKARLGMVEDVNLNNAESSDVIYMRRIYELQRSMADQLTEHLLPRIGAKEGLFFKVGNPVPDDEERKAKVAHILFQTGAATPNEIRAMFGMEEVDGLDVHMVPFSMMELGAEASEGAKELAAKRRKGIVRGRTPHQTLKGMMAKEITKDVMAGVEKAAGRMLSKSGQKPERPKAKKKEQPTESRLTEEQAEALWKKTVATVDGYEKRYLQECRKFLKRQERDVTSALEATEKALDPDVADQVLFSVQAEAEVLLDVELPVLRELVAEMGEETLKLLGMSGFDTATDAIEQVLSVDALKGTYSFNRTTARQIRDILTEAVQEGWGVPETVERIRATYAGISADRAETLARTEIFRANGKATVEAYRQSGVVVAKQWFTAEDERVCPFCREMYESSEMRIRGVDEAWFTEGQQMTVTDENGKEHTLKIGFEDVKAPPLHSRCVTGDTKIRAPGATRAMRMRYRGSIVHLTLADGRRLSVTPNHVLLTDRGWMNAESIRKGDNVVDCAAVERDVDGAPDADQSEATAADIFAALAESGGVTAAGVPVAAEDFHGDGRFADGDVDIVSADGLLSDALEAAATEHGDAAALGGVQAALSLERLRDLDSKALALGLAADGIVCGTCVAKVLGSGTPRHHEAVRRLVVANYDSRFDEPAPDDRTVRAEAIRALVLGDTALVEANEPANVDGDAAADVNAGGVKPAVDDVSGDADGASDVADAHAGGVKFLQVVDVEVDSSHDDYVYDFETASTAYTTEGVMSSNCRCTLLPVTINTQE